MGFALQLGTVRFLGAFLPNPIDLPPGVVSHVGAVGAKLSPTASSGRVFGGRPLAQGPLNLATSTPTPLICGPPAMCSGSGHCVRPEISSNNFPRFNRNPNTGKELGTETDLVPAIHTI